MPTGYTDCIRSGEVTDFETYALRCARNFGALILMRDEPMDAEIKEFEPSTYHAENIERARKELAELLAMSPSEMQAAIDAEHEKAESHRVEQLERIATERCRYEKMLAKAKAFRSPSRDHDEYAKFLVRQLTESIKFDCDTDHYDTPHQKLSVDGWRESSIANLNHELDYHTKEHAAEVERTNRRNEWVRLLREAIKQNAAG